MNYQKSFFLFICIFLLSSNLFGHNCKSILTQKKQDSILDLLEQAANQTQQKDPQSFYEMVIPQISRLVQSSSLQLETEIAQLEYQIRKIISKPVDLFQGLAFRGISARIDNLDSDLAQMKDYGYLSKDGGNFFLLTPERLSKDSVEDLFSRLFSTSIALFDYASRETAAVIIVTRVDKDFPLYPSGGNDGITAEFPSHVTVDGKTYLISTIDVAAVTKPHTKFKTGIILEKVPQANVVKTIIFLGKSFDLEGVPLLTAQRLIYRDILIALLENI